MKPIMEGKGRLMESVLVLPAILEWMDIEFPKEATRGSGSSAYKTSKLDGVNLSWDQLSSTTAWQGQILGNYNLDLEWRDYEK